MKNLEPITKGEKGWRVRRLEIAIMEVISRATTPQTGWGVATKLRMPVKGKARSLKSVSGNDVCLRMAGLKNNGYLKHAGYDDDGDPLYLIEE